jgi:DNA-binding transcriptional LysR family regulator
VSTAQIAVLLLHPVQAIDLNLLPVLAVLLEEENVTRAAARLNLSVPATSRALERARRLLGDPLLARHGRNVVATPRARALLPELSDALARLSQLIGRPEALAPERIKRTFTIRANEAVVAAAGAEILSLAAGEAPHAVIRFELEGADDIPALRRGDVDLAIGSYGDVTSDVESAALLREHLVSLVRPGHPTVAVNSRPSLAQFAGLDHVVVSRHGRRRNAIDATLAEAGLTRTALAVVPSFSVALNIVARSDATTIAPLQLSSLLLDHGALVAFVPPVRVPPVEIAQLWHVSNTNDAPHQWLRSCVSRAAALLPLRQPNGAPRRSKRR